MLWFHLFTEIKQQRNNLFLWFPMAFAFGVAGTFAHGHWIGPAVFGYTKFDFYDYGAKYVVWAGAGYAIR